MQITHAAAAAEARTLFLSTPCVSRGKVILKNRVRDALYLLSASERVGSLLEARGKINAAFMWLMDNAAGIAQIARALLDEKAPRDVQTASSHLPRMYAVFRDFLDTLDEAADADSLDAFLSCMAADETLSFSDFDALPYLLRAACISAVGDVCRGLSDGELYSSEKAAARLSVIIPTLFSLEGYPFEKAYAYAAAEKALICDPAGVYADQTDETKRYYRRLVSRTAKKRQISETAYVKELLAKAGRGKDTRARHIGTYLIPKKDGRPAAMYRFASLTLTGISLGVCAVFSPYLLLAAPTLYEASRMLVSYVFSRFPREDGSVLPALELENIPDTDAVLVVITTLLDGGRSDAEVFDRLERIYASSGMKNICFGVLGDLPDAPHIVTAKDEAAIHGAASRIAALNRRHDAPFFLFLRERTRADGERRYMGKERKRGAVCSLVRYLCGMGNDFSDDAVLPDAALSRKIRYVVTLDADTELPPDAVRIMAGKMLHPLNRPVIDRSRHVVTAGFGILQPRVSTAVGAASRSLFSALHSAPGGCEPYPSQPFDLEESLFGTASFCGKGMFDKYAFAETVLCPETAFPDNTVLSHDILEGERMRCARENDVEMTDGFPKNELSYFKRHHRWVRGDAQNLVFIGSRIPCADGTCVNPFSARSRVKLIDNIRRETVPFFSLALLIVCCFLDGASRRVGILAALLPYLVPLVTSLRSARYWHRRFFASGVLSGFAQTLLRTLYEISALVKTASVTLDALFRAFVRTRITHRKMLEWVTAAQSDAEAADGLLAFVRKNLLSAVVGAAFYVFAPGVLLRLVGVLWFLFPVAAFALSKPLGGKSRLRARDADTLRAYAADTWRYFEQTVGADDHFLPPDNMQLYPDTRIAHRTSPTNIGLYLLCILAARDLHLIDTDVLYARASQTLSTIESLPKWRGHLYNWYDTVTLDILSPHYVSSVDSGNLLACLVAFAEGVKEYADEKASLILLSRRCLRLVEETDVAALYDDARRLFSLGVTVKEDGSARDAGIRYDLLMSESRILSYVAVALRRVPVKHWQRLSRTVIGRGGHIGLASWTGTAFEYTMPSLLLPTVKNTLFEEAIRFALREQKKRRAVFGNYTVTGISESAYHAFDADGAYRYYAFGVPSLSLKRGQEKDLVIAPYASFLFLPFDTPYCLDNLRRLRAGGAYGTYGFFDAADCTPSRTAAGGETVKTVMAHHAGMSMLAAVNVCKDNVFVRRFMRNPAMRGAYGLLCERIPADAPVMKRRRAVKDARPARFAAPVSSIPAKAAAFGDGHVYLIADEHTTRLYAGQIAVNREKEPFDITFSSDGGTVSLPHGAVLYDDGGAARYEKRENGLTASASFAAVYGGSAFAVHLSCRGASEASLGFVPTLMNTAVYESHSAFHKLFLVSRYDAETNTLFFTRRIRGADAHPVCLAVRAGQGAFAYSVRQSQNASAPADGACIDPCCRVCLSLDEGGNGTVFLAVGRDEKAALSALDGAASLSFDSIREAAARTQMPHADEPAANTVYARLLAALALPVRRALPFDAHYSYDVLYQHGISGDLPIFAAYAPTVSSAARLVPILHAARRLFAMGLRHDLVILCRDTEKYASPVASRVRELLITCGVAEYLGRRGGGIFLVDDDTSDGNVSVFETVSADVLTALPPPSAQPVSYEIIAAPLPAARPTSLEPLLACGSGFFTADGYVCTRPVSPSPSSPDCPSPLGPRHSALGTSVLSGYAFGTVMTGASLGFSHASNAVLRRVTPFSDAPDGERLFIRDGNTLYDLAACAAFVYVLPGETRYYGRVGSIDYTVTVCVPAKYAVKLTELRVSKPCDVLYAVRPVMGVSETENRRIAFRTQAGAALFRNIMPDGTRSDTGFVRAEKAAYAFPNSGCFAGCVLVYVSVKGKCIFSLGTFHAEKARMHLFAALSAGADVLKKSARDFAARFKPCVTLDASGDISAAVCTLFNTFLPYQTGMCRLYARSGPSQAGGAYGYRDQLQDILCLMYADPSAARTHLIRAASHTLEDGSVLHWWHPSPDGHDKGIRSRTSDDYLFLPYCTAAYVAYTGDTSLLLVPCPIRTGEPLENGQPERYITTEKSGEHKTVHALCVSALLRGFALVGEHGLPLLGSGDWCDGFSAAGTDMKGESVWLGQFLVVTSRAYLAAAASFLDADTVRELQDKTAAMTAALEAYAYEADGSRYLRAWYDDGTPLGSVKSDEGSLELLPQAFAVFAGVPTDRARTVMRTAYDGLYDAKGKLFKLFSPPYDKTPKNPGYIKSYAAGVRENGGQYTHAAVWGASALIRAALGKEYDAVDEDLLRKGTSAMIDLYPSVRCLDEYLSAAYDAAPYVCTADIYTNEAAYGKGGWSWYTGSAGWLWTATLRELFGVRLCDVMRPGKARILFSKAAHFAPFADERLQNPVLTIRIGGALYRVKYDASAHGITLDGKHTSDTVSVTSGEHSIVVGRENGSSQMFTLS